MRSSNSSLNSSEKPVPRYHGNITLAMIDDFLNPISKKKDVISKIKFAAPPTTNGDGIVEQEAPNEHSYQTNKVDTSYMPFSRRETARDFDYINQQRKNYEKELKESASQFEKHFLDNSVSNLS